VDIIVDPAGAEAVVMESSTTPQVAVTPQSGHRSTAQQIRGSSLLLIGRLLSIGMTFAVQVLIVRYLSRTDYGAFAYVLSMVAMGEIITQLGLDRAITRFVALYHEKRDYAKLFGTIALVLSTILSLGLALILLVYFCQGLITQVLIDDQKVVALLVIMIGLAPAQTLDGLLMSLSAVFTGPRAIFFRKYVLTPGLRLIVVLLLIAAHEDVFFLGGGYLAATVLGIVIYSVILFRILRSQGLFQHFHLRTINLPVREVFAFAIPLLATDLMLVAMNTLDAVLLAYFHDTGAVASFRAVQPAAKMNQVVFASFNLLFTPLAARLLARDDHEGIDSLYTQTAIWTAVLSFPIFALTFSLAQPITLLLYGRRYADSATILTLLSLGYYFNAALGPNVLTLRVFGKIRPVVVSAILAMVMNLGVNLLLIPRYGALGAAVGTSTTWVVYNIMVQRGLQSSTGINLFRWHYLRVYLIIAVAALGLLMVQIVAGLPFVAGLALATFVSALVGLVSRRSLNVGQMFPELLRFRLARRLLGES
jgi:O-antigen/teichoic acid export membrane protein